MTVSISVDYLRPTSLREISELNARVAAYEDRCSVVECSLVAAGKDRARATVRTMRVPDEWRHGSPTR